MTIGIYMQSNSFVNSFIQFIYLPPFLLVKWKNIVRPEKMITFSI